MQPWYMFGRKEIEPVPFEVACACGQLAKGFRQATHQVIVCAGCGRPVFILPRSPLSSPRPIEDRGSRIEDRARERRSIIDPRQGPWRYALVAGAFALAIMVLTVIFQISKKQNFSSDDSNSVSQLLTAGKMLMGQGRFHDAVRELDEAFAIREKNPSALSGADRKALIQLHRQAHLFTDLLNEPLEDILFQATAEPDDREWQAFFSDRYKGKSFIILAGSRRDNTNHWLLDYDVFIRDKRARIDWENLHLLRDLHLDQPQRLLLGARLANVEPEAGGTWVVRLEPDSGVLITDAEAFSTVFSQTPEGWEGVVKRQATWVAEMP